MRARYHKVYAAVRTLKYPSLPYDTPDEYHFSLLGPNQDDHPLVILGWCEYLVSSLDFFSLSFQITPVLGVLALRLFTILCSSLYYERAV